MSEGQRAWLVLSFVGERRRESLIIEGGGACVCVCLCVCVCVQHSNNTNYLEHSFIIMYLF